MPLVAPTLGKLLTNVRNFLGQPNPANSFWTDEEIKEYLNEGVRMYFAEVVKNSDGYFNATTPALLDVVSGTETVALPTDFFEARALYIQRNNGWEVLEYRNDITSSFVTSGFSNGSNTFSPYYFFRANSLVLRPTPQFSQTGVLRLEYMAFPDQMIHGGDAMTNQVSPVFKQLIEAYAVWKAKMKQSMVSGVDMVSIPASQLKVIETLFRDTINKRSQYPEFIVPFTPESTS